MLDYLKYQWIPYWKLQNRKTQKRNEAHKGASFLFCTASIAVTWLKANRSLGALAGGAAHRAGDLREDLADVLGNARHNGACRNSDEASHQSVFDKVLALGVLEDRERPEKILDSVHIVHSSPCNRSSLAAETTIPPKTCPTNWRKHLVRRGITLIVQARFSNESTGAENG